MIKTETQHFSGACRGEFQYQKGAIKTCRHRWVSVVEPEHFNTKKVRLKPPGRSALALYLGHFNTKKVRLKHTLPKSWRYREPNFNTKKVRLKPVSAMNCPSCTIYFNTKKVRLKQ